MFKRDSLAQPIDGLPLHHVSRMFGQDGTIHEVPNRDYFFDTAEDLFEAHKHTEHFLLAYIDLRGFKAVNDTYSHAAGNDALVTFYQRLHESFRTGESIRSGQDIGDVVTAREGGDEFIVLIPYQASTEEEIRTIEVLVTERILSCGFEFQGLLISSRVVFVHSDPAFPVESIIKFFIAADEKMVQCHKAEKSQEVLVHPLQASFDFDF